MECREHNRKNLKYRKVKNLLNEVFWGVLLVFFKLGGVTMGLTKR